LQRIRRTVFWAILSAAFVGPGTVATCARAGSEFGTSLLWALLFSVIACFVLQEMAARLTIVTGDTLGQALRRRWHGGLRGGLIVVMICGAVLLGAAAYQAGNLLGAAAGLDLLHPGLGRQSLWGLALLAAVLLGFARTDLVARMLGVLVIAMGLCFLIAAVPLLPGLPGVLTGLTLPRMPNGSEWIVIALIGTTVVPYNLFLGSSLARREKLSGLRSTLAIAIGLGGLISMAILIVGSASTPPFSFEALGAAITERLGPWARTGFSLGLFAAGLSSAITAPLAAGLTARGLFDDPGRPSPIWADRGTAYRIVWVSVLLVGTFFGVSAGKPVPMIIAAQAFNGMLLPIVAVFLWLATRDRKRMGDAAYGPLGSAVAAVIVLAATVLGAIGLVRAAASLGLLPAVG
jgi:Mn2+/Fe2+ NRAMP family transporter